jgi:hypothetical protein
MAVVHLNERAMLKSQVGQGKVKKTVARLEGMVEWRYSSTH